MLSSVTLALVSVLVRLKRSIAPNGAVPLFLRPIVRLQIWREKFSIQICLGLTGLFIVRRGFGTFRMVDPE